MPRRFAFKHPCYFHVLNRAVRKDRLFHSAGDYQAFMRALGYAQGHFSMPILAYCVMPNHFHLVVGPTATPALSAFMHRLTITHSKRWHVAHGSVGTGSVYQGRFKALRIKDDAHFLTVCRYVERNPVRAGLVGEPGDWLWSSAATDCKNCDVVLSPLPIVQ
jgi:putative transposase